MSKFNDLTIKAKLVTAFALIAATASIIGGIGLINLKSISNNEEILYSKVTIPLSHLEELSKSFQRIRINLRDLVAAKTPTERDRFIATIQELTKTLNSMSEAYAATINNEEEQRDYEAFLASRKAFVPYRDQIETLALADQVEEAFALLQGDAFKAAKTEEALIDELVEQKVTHASSMHDANQAKVWTATLEMAGAMVLGMFFALGMGSFIAGMIAKRIVALETAARKVSEGDLTVVVKALHQDELGRLNESFNTMIQHIRDGRAQIEWEKAGVEQKVEEAVREAEEQHTYLARSVDMMLHKMEAFAAGDLSVSLQIERADAMGRLYEGFNHAVKNIRDLFADIYKAVEATTSVSGTINRAAGELAAATQEQSSQAMEVAAAVEQMAQTIVENANNAARTSEVAAENRRIAQDGGGVVGKTVEKIRQIAEVVGSSAKTVEKLGESSKEIGKIVAVIDDIADQTNLLALNAAIEAARAGDQGRGFAVVADEVRKLAERTTDATKQIANMIQAVQAETEVAVGAMQQGNAEMNEGIALADRAGDALREIVTGVQNSVGLVDQIAAASEEQSSASEQISRAVEAISDVSHTSAQEVGEVAQSAEELGRLMEELTAVVSRFNLEATEVRHDVVGADAALPTLNMG